MGTATRLSAMMKEKCELLIYRRSWQCLNKLLLEDQVQDHHGDHGQQAACHQHREVGGVLTVQVERPADRVIMFRSVLQISGHIRSA